AQFYGDPLYHKPDYRAAAATIQALQQPGDVIVTDGIDPNIVFLHYYKGGLPLHDLRFLAEVEGEEIAATLTEITTGATRIWEVLYFHEPAAVQHWLALHGWSAPPSEHNGIRVSLYGMPASTLPKQALTVAFGAALTLTGAAVSAGPVAHNQLLRVSTEWQVNEPPPDLKFSLRLLDGNNQALYAQDYVPQNWFAPTSTWAVGQTTGDQRGILVPPQLPAGRYRITVRLYDPATGVAVETSVGQDVTLGEVEVQP
ncbi:MAG: hypothetical protein M3Q45_00295, partial [Chloroflexota bacterium]|nr:hypothetical protein [Chloroflexota bacterium]